MSPKPNGSNIEVIDEVNGVTFRWDRPDSKALRFLICGFGLVQFGVFFGLMLPEMIGQMNQQGAAPAQVLIPIVMFGVFALFGFAMFYFLVRKGLPESVTLGRDSLRYDPGRQAAISIWFNPWWAMKYSDPTEVFSRVFRRRKVIDLPKEELGRVILDRAGERQRIYFDLGADRIEIGECLREPEREWLASVIQEWQSAS